MGFDLNHLKSYIVKQQVNPVIHNILFCSAYNIIKTHLYNI